MKLFKVGVLTLAFLGSGNALFSGRLNGDKIAGDDADSRVRPVSEKYCNGLTEQLCRNSDGYWMRYSVFDPATQECVCSTKPSDYMVSHNFKSRHVAEYEIAPQAVPQHSLRVCFRASLLLALQRGLLLRNTRLPFRGVERRSRWLKPYRQASFSL